MANNQVMLDIESIEFDLEDGNPLVVDEKDNSTELDKPGTVLEIDDISSFINSQADADVEEEETDEEEEEVEEADKDEVEIPTDGENLIAAFAEELLNHGVITNIDSKQLKDVTDFEGLLGLMKGQLETTYNTWQEDYKKNLIKNLVDEGYIKQEDVNVNTTSTYTEESLEDEEVAKEFLVAYYKRMDMSDKAIERILKNAIDVVEQAKETLPDYEELLEKEQANVAKKLEEKEKQKQRDTLEAEKAIEKNVLSYTEFIPGKKMDDKFKKEVFKNIPVTLQKIQADWQKYYPILSYLDKYGMLDGKFDEFVKVKQTEAVNKFTTALSKKGVKQPPVSVKTKYF